MRTASSTACATANSGKTWAACDGTENHNRSAVDRDRKKAQHGIRHGMLAQQPPGEHPSTSRKQSAAQCSRAAAGERSRTPAPPPAVRHPGSASPQAHVLQHIEQQSKHQVPQMKSGLAGSSSCWPGRMIMVALPQPMAGSVHLARAVARRLFAGCEPVGRPICHGHGSSTITWAVPDTMATGTQ
jgi:hypothetical protein